MQQRPATTASNTIIISGICLHRTMQFVSVCNEVFQALSVHGNQVLTTAMIQAISMAAHLCQCYAWTGFGSMQGAACAHAVCTGHAIKK